MTDQQQDKAREIECFGCGKTLSDGHVCALSRMTQNHDYGIEDDPNGAYVYYGHANQIIESLRTELAEAKKEITRLSGQSGSCAECERLRKQLDWYANALTKRGNVNCQLELDSRKLSGQIQQLLAEVERLKEFRRIVIQGWQQEIQEWVDDGEPDDANDRDLARAMIDEQIKLWHPDLINKPSEVVE